MLYLDEFLVIWKSIKFVIKTEEYRTSTTINCFNYNQLFYISESGGIYTLALHL